MTFPEAIKVMRTKDGDMDEARTVITRAVCDELGIAWASDEAARLGDWIAAGEYTGIEDAALLADEWKTE